MRSATAAVARDPGAPFRFERVTLRAIDPDEVRIRLVATGICHADLLARDQVYPVPLPVVLGHEGAGVVEECGTEVVGLQAGDHVVLGFAYCARCESCLAGYPGACDRTAELNFGSVRLRGTQPVSDERGEIASSFFGQSSFASKVIVPAYLAVRVDRTLPLRLLAPLGCGVMTGAGTVFHVLDPRPGSSIAVFGAGAVGCAAIMAAVVAGCSTIVAVDVDEHRLDVATECGATRTLRSQPGVDVAAELKALSDGRGVAAAIDATGVASVFLTVLECLAPHGHAALVGAPAPGDRITVDLNWLLGRGVRVSMVLEGDAHPQRFIPELARLMAAGRLPIEKIVTTYPFEALNEAIAAAVDGTAVKAVVVFGDDPRP